MKSVLESVGNVVEILGLCVLFYKSFDLINALTAYLKFKTRPSTTTIILKNEAEPKADGNR